ncbi:putative membrane protein [Arcticibacter svalbardensis MN12-7]|uniref:Putative membrane protein n=1 Tax=Arcticibacter svalbardensis MN12-7 TaxID=1150600 RepID=R9GU10_9SPHI|nr:peptidoglycan DD-metalloendopeptidase family protein [Arcticibacter svalbardensis]EOR95030.1 putative membrane protein [Arcticibacter svalbardensis MN12-7]
MSLIRVFFIFTFILIAGTTFAQSSSELKRRKESLTREIEMLRKSQNKVVNNKRLSLRQINALNAQIRLRQEKISTINSEVRLLDNQISENSNNVRSLQSQLNRLKKEYAAMILFAFRNQSSYSKLMFIFASTDFNQAYKRLKYLQQFGDYRRKQANYIQQTQKDLGYKIVQLDHNKREKSTLLQDQEKEKITLGKEKSNQSVQLSKLSKQEKELRQELSQKQKESARLNRAIQNAISREIEAERRKAAALAAAAAKAAAAKGDDVVAKPVATGTKVLSATPESAKMTSDFTGNRGSLPWPVANGTIVERFGRHNIGNVSTENNGVNIQTNEGAGVRAIFAGTVTSVLNMGSSSAIIIRHGEYFTVYTNLRSVNVSKGQKVSVKQGIGTVASDPSDGSSDVHLEIWKGSTPMNPEAWLAN